ncbi:MAG: flavodoxin family protein [Cetobacterium sp.]
MKKTLIFLGAARKNGETRAIVDEFKKHLIGNVEVIDTYRLTNIAPCMDCRGCWKSPKCLVKDGMTEIYNKIESADNFIFATPMYFHSVPAPMKLLIDRCQVYWASRMRGEKKEITKKSVIAMVGGAPQFENQFKAGYQLLKEFSRELCAEVIGTIELSNTDKVSLEDSPELKEKIKMLSEKFL